MSLATPCSNAHPRAAGDNKFCEKKSIETIQLGLTSFIQTYQISHLIREHTSLCEYGPNTCSHLHGNGNGPKHSSHPRMSDQLGKQLEPIS